MTAFKHSSAFVKNMLLFLLLMTASTAISQSMQVTFDEPQEEQKYWQKAPWNDFDNINILDWNDNEIVIYSLRQYLYLARIDKNLNLKENSKTKVGKSFAYEDEILRIWHENDNIYIVVREDHNVYLLTYDFRSLQQTDMKQIYTLRKHSTLQVRTPVDIAWSDNGEYIAIVARHIPYKTNELGLRKKQGIFHEFGLYDKHFNPIGSGVFDAVDLPLNAGKGYGYASSWTLTDNGEIVFVSLKAARNPADYPEFGATATQMEIGLFKDGKMTTSTIPNVYRGNLPVGAFNCTEDIVSYENRNSFSMSLRTGSILGYDGKSMMIFFLNTLYKYSFEDNTVTPQVAMPFCLEPVYYSSGVSNVIDDNEGGHIIRGVSGYVWIPKDITKSFVGTWEGGRESSKGSVTTISAVRSLTFLRNDRLYHIANMEKKTQSFSVLGGASETKERMAPQLTSVDIEKKIEKRNLDAVGYLNFYRISDNRIALWERDIKVDGKKCQRFGYVDLP